MFLIGAAINQNIIKENDNELAQTGSKGGIHGALKRPWGFCQSKGHDSEFELAKMGLEGSFKFLPGLQQNLVKTCPQIEVGKP